MIGLPPVRTDRREVDGKQTEVRVARITALAIVGGILAKNQNVAFLVALAFAVAASANLPPLLYSLFWNRFNTLGALWSMYGGLTITIGTILSREHNEKKYAEMEVRSLTGAHAEKATAH